MFRLSPLLLVLAALPVWAQSVSTDVSQEQRIRALIGDRATLNTALPVRGMRSASVQRQFGKPKQKMPAVGKPPIVRWIYADYMVTFEGDYVLNATLKHRPPLQPALPMVTNTAPPIPVVTDARPATNNNNIDSDIAMPETASEEAERVNGLY